jgi:hypothetical protein
VCLANLHGLAATSESYLAQFAERYPFARAGTPLLVVPDDGRPPAYITTSSHWDLGVLWPALMHRTAPWKDHFATWVCAGSRRDRAEIWTHPDGYFAPSYRYSNSFIARPETWTGSAIPDPRLLAPVSAGEVPFPSSKVLFYDSEMAHVSVREPAFDAKPMLSADGHAAVHRVSAASAPVMNPFTGLARPLDDTPRGVRGRDY